MTNEIVTAAYLNTNIKDDESHLKDLADAMDSLVFGGGIQASRANFTTYQNTSGAIMMVTVVEAVANAQLTIDALVENTSPPSVVVARAELNPTPSANCFASLSFLVPSQWYYYVISLGGSLQYWTEYQLQ